MAEHALLSASGSGKWLTCTPSARVEELIPDETSSHAAEGTICHALVEIKGRHAFFGEPLPADLSMYSLEMHRAADRFIEECEALVAPLRAAGVAYTVLIEQRLDFSPWVPEGFGTGDFVLVCGHTIWVRDFKYGVGVPVESEGNTQMLLYALGAYNELAFAYDEITEVDIGVVQPRIGNVTSARVSLDYLLNWGDMIKPIAAQAWAGEGEFVAGDHCSSCFCRARFNCAARAEAALAVATKEFGLFPKGPFLTPSEIAELLPKLESVTKWAKDLEAFARGAALEGQEIPGYKLVEGRSIRKITDPKTAAVRLVANGFRQEEIYTEPELITLTALQDLVGGRKPFDQLLGDLIEKPPGKPTLVPLSDKRPAWSSADTDFAL